ncbi:MAG: murein L,D-transpeptidase [Caulobacteraceae bacterium]|nr:murein L,D-transpeptidase [Caulobacteraceae bacterium]
MKLLAALSLWGFLFGQGDKPAAERESAVRPPIEQRLAKAGLHRGDPVFIRIFKQDNRLELWLAEGGRYRLFQTYPICKWSGDLGPKVREGDHQAPEGFYAVTPGQMNPHSKYHKAFNLGFPNAYDRAMGRSGSALMVHGACGSVGCYAMTDPGIDEIYDLMSDAFARGQGQVAVDILPFRMTPANLAAHAASPWTGFWRSLAPADAQFRTSGRPAPVFSCQGRYAFVTGPGCQTVRAAT